MPLQGKVATHFEKVVWWKWFKEDGVTICNTFSIKIYSINKQALFALLPAKRAATLIWELVVIKIGNRITGTIL